MNTSTLCLVLAVIAFGLAAAQIGGRVDWSAAGFGLVTLSLIV
jgi:hypothetical protein